MDVGLCQWWVWDVGLFDFVDLVCGFVNVVGCCRVFIFFLFFIFYFKVALVDVGLC